MLSTEHQSGKPEGGGRSVKNFSPVERRRFEAHVSRGLLVDRRGIQIDTGQGRFMFVMDRKGQICIYLRVDMTGKVHHSSLLAGGDAAMAGELEAPQGRLTVFSDKIGHHPFDRGDGEAVPEAPK